MPVQLTMCRLCTRSRPDVYNTIAQLVAAFPEDLIVVELECMAACDDVPAVMVETDYLPLVTPCQLEQIVRQHVEPLRDAA